MSWQNSSDDHSLLWSPAASHKSLFTHGIGVAQEPASPPPPNNASPIGGYRQGVQLLGIAVSLGCQNIPLEELSHNGHCSEASPSLCGG